MICYDKKNALQVIQRQGIFITTISFVEQKEIILLYTKTLFFTRVMAKMIFDKLFGLGHSKLFYKSPVQTLSRIYWIFSPLSVSK